MVNKGNLSEKLPTPIQLVLLLQDLEFGGTQRYAIHLLKNLDRNLFDPHLWVLSRRDGHGPFGERSISGK